MANVLGSAFIEILPLMAGFSGELQRGLKREESRAEIKIPLSPEVAKFSKDLGKGLSRSSKSMVAKIGLQADMQKFRRSLGKEGTESGRASGKNFKKSFGSSLKNIGPAVGLGVALAGVGAGLKDTVSKAADFEKVMNQVGVQTDAAGGDMKSLQKLAVDMGNSTIFSAQGAADAMLELAKGGMTQAQIKAGGLQETLTLATAGGLDLGDAATYMVNSLNAFKIPAKNSAQVSTALAGAANASTASVQSLGLGLAQVAGQASISGLSLQSTVAGLSALDNAGVKGSDAGTSLKTMLQRLVPQTKKAEAAFEELGLMTMDSSQAAEYLRKNGIKPLGTDQATLTKQLQKYAMELAGTTSYTSQAQAKFVQMGNEAGFASNQFFDANGNIKDMASISKVLSTALKGQTKEQKISTLYTLFGSDASRAAGFLAEAGSKKIEMYTKAAKDRAQAEKLAAVATEGYKGAQDRLGGTIESLQITLGGQFLPILSKTMIFMAEKAVPAVGKLAEQIGPKILPALSRFGDFFKSTILPTLKKFGDYVTTTIVPVLVQFGSFFATKILPVLKEVAGFVITKLIPAVGSIVAFMIKWQNVLIPIAAGIGAMVVAFKAYQAAMQIARIATAAFAVVQGVLNVVMSANPLGIIILALIGIGVALVVAYKKSDKFRAVVQTVWAAIKIAIKFAWQKVIKPVFNALKTFFTDILPKAAKAFKNKVSDIWDAVKSKISTVWGGIKKVLNAVKTFFTDTIPTALSNFKRGWAIIFDAIKDKVVGVWEDKIKPVLTKLKDFFKDHVQPAFTKAKDAIGTILDGIRDKAARPINFVIDTVYNNGLRKALNLIPGVNLAEANTIKLANGGVLPGYTPGRDVHNFVSPTGGRLALSGGEAVMRPEFTRAMGKAGINTLNAAARQGGATGVAKAMSGLSHAQHFAGGGLTSFKGGTFTSPFAARLAQVAKTNPFSVFQGGFRPATSYSGTSHAKDAVDVGPVSGGLVQALRRVGIAAWDRTGMGNWAPHIHGVPLPGAGTAGGSAVWQAQDYLRGGNGLGGKDNGAGSAGPNGTGSFVDYITKIPSTLTSLISKIKDMSDSGWSGIAMKAAKGAANAAVDTINKKIPGDLLDLPHFAGGGRMVSNGLAVVGERGPEVVRLPGGSRVYPNGGSGGTGGRPMTIQGTLDLGNGLHGYVKGIVSDEIDGQAAFDYSMSRMRG